MGGNPIFTRFHGPTTGFGAALALVIAPCRHSRRRGVGVPNRRHQHGSGRGNRALPNPQRRSVGDASPADTEGRDMGSWVSESPAVRRYRTWNEGVQSPRRLGKPARNGSSGSVADSLVAVRTLMTGDRPKRPWTPRLPAMGAQQARELATDEQIDSCRARIRVQDLDHAIPRGEWRIADVGDVVRLMERDDPPAFTSATASAMISSGWGTLTNTSRDVTRSNSPRSKPVARASP
jgi:hypothetical protein